MAKEPVSRPSGGGGKSAPSRSAPSRSKADMRDDRPSGGRSITPVAKPISGGRSAAPVARPISGGGIKDVRAQQLMTNPLAPGLSTFPQRPGQTTGTMLSSPGQLPARVNPMRVDQPLAFPIIPESVIGGSDSATLAVDPETIAAQLPLGMRPSAYDYMDAADIGNQRLLSGVFSSRPAMPAAPAPMTPPAFATSPQVGGAVPKSVADAGRMMGINEIPAMSRPASAPAVLPSIADAGRMMGVNDIPAMSQPATQPVRNYVGSGATPLSGEPYLNYDAGRTLTQAGINQMERAGLDVRGVSPGGLPTTPEIDRMTQTGYADPVFRMGAPTTDLGGTQAVTPATQTGGGATMSPGAVAADIPTTPSGGVPPVVVPGSVTIPGLGLLAGAQNLLSGGFRDAMSGLFNGEFRDTRSPEQRASDWFAAQREMDRGSDRVSAAPVIPETDDGVLEDMPSPTMPTEKPAWWPDYLPWPPRQTAPVTPAPVPPLPTAPVQSYTSSYGPTQSAITAGLAGMPMRFS